MSVPVLFVLGAGPKIGFSVARAFAAKGYKVALAARSLTPGESPDGTLHLKLDLSNPSPSEIQTAFATVTEKLGIPSVGVYNAAANAQLDPSDPLASVTAEDTTRIYTINVLSPLVAAQSAVAGFKQLPSTSSRTFIATGNLLVGAPWPSLLTFGMAKSALAHLIWGSSIAYEKQGFGFYYADERQADGGPTVPVGGEAAGEAYWELAERREQGPWNWTFVKGKGYVEFK